MKHVVDQVDLPENLLDSLTALGSVVGGYIVEVVANGYLLGDAVLRPAKVKIAKQ